MTQFSTLIPKYFSSLEMNYKNMNFLLIVFLKECKNWLSEDLQSQPWEVMHVTQCVALIQLERMQLSTALDLKEVIARKIHIKYLNSNWRSMLSESFYLVNWWLNHFSWV